MSIFKHSMLYIGGAFNLYLVATHPELGSIVAWAIPTVVIPAGIWHLACTLADSMTAEYPLVPDDSDDA